MGIVSLIPGKHCGSVVEQGGSEPRPQRFICFRSDSPLALNGTLYPGLCEALGVQDCSCPFSGEAMLCEDCGSSSRSEAERGPEKLLGIPRALW